MKKKIWLLLIIIPLFISSCNNSPKQSSLDSIEQERLILDKIEEAIYMADYPVKQGELVSVNSIKLPASYKDVKIAWRAINFPEIVDSTGTINRPNTCWIESRDQQGVEKFPNININWPVVLEASFEYMGRVEKHKLLIQVKPVDGYTCDKYKG